MSFKGTKGGTVTREIMGYLGATEVYKDPKKVCVCVCVYTYIYIYIYRGDIGVPPYIP